MRLLAHCENVLFPIGCFPGWSATVRGRSETRLSDRRRLGHESALRFAAPKRFSTALSDRSTLGGVRCLSLGVRGHQGGTRPQHFDGPEALASRRYNRCQARESVDLVHWSNRRAPDQDRRRWSLAPLTTHELSVVGKMVAPRSRNMPCYIRVGACC